MTRIFVLKFGIKLWTGIIVIAQKPLCLQMRGCYICDHMVDIFITTYAIMKGFTDINRQKVIWDVFPTMLEIAIFWFQIHITNGLNSLHRKWRTGNQYRVTAVEIRMRSNLELLPVMNVKKWLKIAVCSSPLDIYHRTDNIIKQSFISSSSCPK